MLAASASIDYCRYEPVMKHNSFETERIRESLRADIEVQKLSIVDSINWVNSFLGGGKIRRNSGSLECKSISCIFLRTFVPSFFRFIFFHLSIGLASSHLPASVVVIALCDYFFKIMILMLSAMMPFLVYLDDMKCSVMLHICLVVPLAALYP